MNLLKFIRRRLLFSDKMVWGMLAVFLVAALVTAYLTFVFVKGVVASRFTTNPPQVNEAPNLVETEVAIDPQFLNKPMQEGAGPAPEPWDGASRVNILVMGLDFRDWEGGGPSRTDTMILVTIDPATHTAGMLSIPRDLWVKIPGYDYAKINTAYFWGEADHVEGGGPALAMKTVEDFLGVPIQYYARIDFQAFVEFIDELGGIELNIPEEISVDPIGPHNTVVLKPGVQLLDGPTALAYARNRDTANGDFDRATRQRQVIFAIRDRILNLNMLPLLIKKSPILYKQLKSGVHTNLTLDQMIKLAWLAAQIPKENIKQAAIGLDQADATFSYDGQYILQPRVDEIRLLRDEIFTNTGPAAPAVPTGDPAQSMADEHATISVLNGTSQAGLASRTKEYLIAQGMNVTKTDNAQEAYDLTTIIDYTGKLYTRQLLADLMNIQPSQVFSRYDPNSPVDIAILLGNDWAASNPMP
jgi:LCP family protein required for cell wall assembly